MFSIYDGREKFFQWDKDRQLIVEDKAITEVHFANCFCPSATVCEVKNGLVNVPNELLTQDLDIRVWAYDGEMTKHEQKFEVEKKPKPADYIHTQTEVWTVEKAVDEAVEAVVSSGELDGADGLHGDTPCVSIKHDAATGKFLYSVYYATNNNEPDKNGIEIWDNTDAEFLPEDYPPMLTEGTGEYEGMLVYSVNRTHIPAGMTRKLINLKVKRNIKNAVLRLKIKYLSVGIPFGIHQTKENPKLFVSDVWATPNVYGADYTITDEAGNPVGHTFEGLELDKWYVVYITANNDNDFNFWPVWQHEENMLIEAVIKDVELLHHEAMPAYLIANSGNCGPMSLYKTADGSWNYAYSSFYEVGSTANTAYYRRLSMKLDAADYVEARFDFMFSKAEYQSHISCDFKADVPMTIVDSNGNEVPTANRQLNTWYTAILKKADRSKLPKQFDLYPMGYADGTTPGILNIEMRIKNCRAYKYME